MLVLFFDVIKKQVINVRDVDHIPNSGRKVDLCGPYNVYEVVNTISYPSIATLQTLSDKYDPDCIVHQLKPVSAIILVKEGFKGEIF